MIEPSLTSRAIEAAVAVAASEGLRCDTPLVIGGHSNTLVHLYPHPVVARVATGTGLVREGPGWLDREVAVTTFLRTRDVPAIAPTERIDPGPHQSSGLSLSFWPLLKIDDARRFPGRAAAALRICHEALVSFSGDLPVMASLVETRRLISHPRVVAAVGEDEIESMEGKAASVFAALEDHAPDLRPIHGDAHPGNFLSSDQGALWIDWEDTFLGPIEWDLACLVTRLRLDGDAAGEREALEGYGAPYDEALLSWMIEGRLLQRVVWSALLR